MSARAKDKCRSKLRGPATTSPKVKGSWSDVVDTSIRLSVFSQTASVSKFRYLVLFCNTATPLVRIYTVKVMAAKAKPLPTAPPRLKPHELADISTFCDIMHLIHHRNLNQHRHSIWWSSFSVFRRELSHFLSEYNTYLPPADLTNPATTKPSAKASKIAARRAAARLEAWKKDAVPRWYLAFAEVISSTQFSAIGLVLLGILARVAQVAGITATYENEAEQAMQELLRKFAEKDAKELFGAVEQGGIGLLKGDEGPAGEDLGEVVGRRDDIEEPGRTKLGTKTEKNKQRDKKMVETQPNAEVDSKKKKKEKRVAQLAAEPESEIKEMPRKRKKTKKGKSSAIDDLFAGL